MDIHKTVITDEERREFERMMNEGIARNAQVIGCTLEVIDPGKYRDAEVAQFVASIGELYELHSDALWCRNVFSIAFEK